MNAWDPEVNNLFLDALEAASAEERRAFLDRACGGNSELRARVEALIAASDQAGSFLDKPALALGPRVDTAAPSGDDSDSGDAWSSSAPATEQTGSFIGPYKLVQKLGEGGMGAVWVAEQNQGVKRSVALKLIKSGMDSRHVIRRFEQERQALAIMDHPHIAKVLDAGATENGRPYFVMELVKGVPITKYCDELQLPLRERLELFLTVCQAIQHAHQKGIIHRDIKPSNVLVAIQDGKPAVKVIDFGVAKALHQQLTEQSLCTEVGQVVGTLEYMSPEQAELSSLDIDTRADVYALGVLLYELLTGTTPLERQRLKEMSILEVLRRIREEEPPRPSTRISTLGQAAMTVSSQRRCEPRRLGHICRGELDWIVMKALEKDRNRRYESASALAADVQRYLHDEAVQACPPSAGYRLQKFVRRNKGALATASVLAVAVLVVVGVIAGSFGWVARDRSVRQAKLNLEIEHALDDAARARDQALTLTDNPSRWEAALAEAASDLKRAERLAAQDESAVQPATEERLHALQGLLEADETDRLFASDFEKILFRGYEHIADPSKNLALAFTLQKEAFGRHYGIAFGATPVEQAAALVKQRPKPVQGILLGALDISRQHAPKDDEQVRPWLVAVLDAADSGAWRRRARQAAQAGDWQAFEQAFEGAVTAKQPPPMLDYLIAESPWDSPVHLKLLRRFRQAYPDNFWANHSLAGYLHYTQGQLGEAIRYYTAALALRPHNPMACLNLGNAIYSTGDLDEAISAYREAIEEQPDNTAAHIVLGKALAEKGQWGEAATQYARVIELEPDNRESSLLYAGSLVMAGETADYQAFCKRLRDHLASNADPANHRITYLVARSCLLAPGGISPADGVRLAEQALAAEPRYAWYLHTLALGHYRAGQFQRAVERLQESMEVDPDWLGRVDDWLLLSLAHQRLGHAAQADQWLAKAFAALPQEGLRTSLIHQHDRLACEVLRRELDALMKRADAARAHNYRGITLRAKRDMDSAVAEFRQAIASDPKFAPAHHNLGTALYDQKKLDEAISCCRTAIRLDPENPDYCNTLAWFLATCAPVKLRNPAEAVKLAQKAVELAPKEGMYWNTLGAAHHRAGNWKGTVAALEKSMELRKGGDSFDWLFLAMAHWQLGEKEKARDWFDKAGKWMDQNLPKNEELRRFRAEAAELLKIEPKKK